MMCRLQPILPLALLATLFGWASAFANAPSSASKQPSEKPRPNVLFILADDLGWSDTSIYGSTFHQTPNIDRLARRGIRFTNAYAANPLCSPTRASILTGRYPERVGITTPACHLPQAVLEAKLSPKGRPHQKAITPRSATRLKTTHPTLAKTLQ